MIGRQPHLPGWLAAVAAVAASLTVASCAAGPVATPARPAATAGPSGPAGPVGAASPATAAAPAGLARPRVLLQGSITHGVEPLSIAFGHGSVWLAFRGAPPAGPGAGVSPGELVRVSARTLRVTARWPIVGSPVAIAVTRHFVWVAGDIYDGRPPAYDANHVQQFSLGGALVHTYDVNSPVGMVGQGDSAWVEYGGVGSDRTYLRRLHDGVASAPAKLSARDTFGAPGNRLVVACQDGVYAATANLRTQWTYVDRFSVAWRTGAVRRTGSARFHHIGNSVLGCGRRGGVLAITQSGGTLLRQLPFGGGTLPAAVRLPDYSYGLGAAGGAPWIGLNNYRVTSTWIWQRDDGPLRRLDAATVPVNVILSVAVGRWLWTAGQDNRHANRWIIVELTRS